MERRAFLSAAIGALAALPAARTDAGGDTPRRLHRGAIEVFGATLTVTVMHGDALRAQQAIGAALRAAQEMERLTDLHDSGSVVCRLNRDGELAGNRSSCRSDFGMQPGRQLVAMLSQACALSELTGGAFDVTVQPLLQVFEDAQRWGAVPEQHRVDEARAAVNWRRLAFGRDAVRFLQPGMALTLDGLAPGYAADLALSALRRHGVHDALIDMGGIAGGSGTPGDDDGGVAWTAGLCGGDGAPFALAPLRNRCMATALAASPGNGGVVNPSTGEAAEDLARVTVLAPLGLLADGLSTAFMVMGAKKAHALAARLPGIDVLTVDRQGAMRRSAGFGMVAV
jgi:thiamine biosynthesis lipoprotein